MSKNYYIIPIFISHQGCPHQCVFCNQDRIAGVYDEVTANDVRLPEMSIKPYVSYGAGVQRRFKDDKYTAFGQTMVHSGGRNGVSLTFGLRWRVGKE